MTLVDLGLHASSNTGAAISTLPDAFDAGWKDVPNDLGSFSFKLDIDDPAAAECTDGRIVRFAHTSVSRWAGVIDFNAPTPREEAAEGRPTITVSGKGLGVELDEAKTRPKPAGKSPGTIADIDPPIDDRWMEWYGVDFDDSSGWVDSVEVGLHGEGSAVWPGLPGGMRVLGAKWIWLAFADDDFLLFREWVYLTPGSYCLDFAAYDAACFINGRRHPRNCAWGEKERVEFKVNTAGYILLAFEADLRDVNMDPGLVWQITEGPDGALVYASGPDMQVYATVDPVIGMTATEIMLALKADHDSLDDWDFDFTAALDSAGNSVSGTSSISVRIGDDSLWDILTALSEVYIDFDFSAARKTLYVWEKGYRPAASSLPIIAGGTAAAETGFVNVVELAWDHQRPEFNALMVRDAAGWFERPATLPTNPRFGSVGLPHIEKRPIAEQFADALLAVKGVDQDTCSLELVQNLPDEQLPYVGFDKWSILDVPNDDLSDTVATPVASITCEMDEDGEMVTLVELGALWEERAKRVERWIARSTRGGLSGLVQMAQGISRETRQRPPGLNQTEVVLFDANGQVDGATSQRTMPGKGLIHKLLARVTDPAGGTSSVDVTIGGTTVTLSGTTGAGFQLLDIDEGLNIAVDPRTEAMLEMTTVGHEKVVIYAAISEYR